MLRPLALSTDGNAAGVPDGGGSGLAAAAEAEAEAAAGSSPCRRPIVTMLLLA